MPSNVPSRPCGHGLGYTARAKHRAWICARWHGTREARRSVNSPTAHIPLFALLALAVLFGHDALMATGLHDTATPAHHSHAAGDHGDASHDAPELTCHLSEGARPASAGVSEPLPAGTAAMPVPAADDWRVTELVAWQAPPITPPDVVRALLQVFLN